MPHPLGKIRHLGAERHSFELRGRNLADQIQSSQRLDLALLASLGVLHTGLAYVILFAVMARLTLGKIAVLQFVYSLAAVLFDWEIYGTRLSMLQMAGVAWMGAAAWAIRKPSR